MEYQRMPQAGRIVHQDDTGRLVGMENLAVTRARAPQPPALPAVALLLALLCVPLAQAATAGNTLLSDQSCQYALLDLEDGGFIVMRITGGEHFPRPGDRLSGNDSYQSGDFSEITHSRTDTTLRIWIDAVINDEQQALSRYYRRCR